MFQKMFALVLAVLLIAVCISFPFIYQQGVNTSYQKGLEAGRQESKKKIGDLEKQLAEAPKPPHDPTYAEMMDFLQQDPTSERIPTSPDDTWTFAPEVKKNSEKKGIKSCVVLVKCEGFIQMINGYNTTDRGFQFIEPQEDKPVTLRIGEGYMSQNGFPPEPNKRSDKILMIHKPFIE